MTSPLLSKEVWDKAQELHDAECSCGSTDASDILGWVGDAQQKLQLYTWMQDENSRPSIMQKLRDFITHNILRRK